MFKADSVIIEVNRFDDVGFQLVLERSGVDYIRGDTLSRYVCYKVTQEDCNFIALNLYVGKLIKSGDYFTDGIHYRLV